MFFFRSFFWGDIYVSNKQLGVSLDKCSELLWRIKSLLLDMDLRHLSGAQLDARLTGDQEFAGSIPARSAAFFRGAWSWKFLAKECAQYWLTGLRTKPVQWKYG